MNEQHSSPGVPPDAVRIGDDAYMVPIGKDTDGCMQYRMHAPGRAVPQVIFYANGKGGFTMNRAEAADCPPSAHPPAGSGR
jgi:hypothetical protein